MDRREKLKTTRSKIRILTNELYSYLNIREEMSHAINDVPSLSASQLDSLFQEIMEGLLEIPLSLESLEFCENNQPSMRQL